jgi:putative SOS response-associated peptidase YedK
MCGRFTQTLKRDDLIGVFPQVAGVGDDHDLFERFNVAPTQDVLAVIERKGERRMGPLRWGLVPFWAKDVKVGARMINARMETLATKAPFKDLVAHERSRCLIVADGYYEWLKPEDPKAPRVPMYFTLPGHEPFAFAGLWTWWNPPGDGERLASATIITTAANRTVAPIHDRMPAILPDAAARDAWLAPGAEVDDLMPLLAPLPDDLVSVAPANPLVNSYANEGPELLTPPAT